MGIENGPSAKDMGLEGLKPEETRVLGDAEIGINEEKHSILRQIEIGLDHTATEAVRDIIENAQKKGLAPDRASLRQLIKEQINQRKKYAADIYSGRRTPEHATFEEKKAYNEAIQLIELARSLGIDDISKVE